MKTTKKDFELFKQEARKWIDFFGLKDWSVHFAHEQPPEGSGLDAYAWFSTNYEGRVATLALTKDWSDNEISPHQIKKSAFHEVCEVLLSTLQDLAMCRDWDAQEYTKEKHAVIRRLENAVWEEV